MRYGGGLNTRCSKSFSETHEKNFVNRPIDGGPTHLAYGAQDMVFAKYGPQWTFLRKLCSLNMLGPSALEKWTYVRSAELGHMLKAMCESSHQNKPVVIAEILSYTMANMIGQVILSRRVFETKGTDSNEFKDMVVELMTIAGYFNIGDFIPSIAWMDLQGIQRGMRRLHKKFDALLTRMIEEHAKTAYERKEKPDFLDILVSHQDSTGIERLSKTNVKALLLVRIFSIINILF